MQNYLLLIQCQDARYQPVQSANSSKYATHFLKQRYPRLLLHGMNARHVALSVNSCIMSVRNYPSWIIEILTLIVICQNRSAMFQY
jgi:hypothetical protein